eukprot:scaffold2110_cov19-Tisochrysis_lutea.AAC.1
MRKQKRKSTPPSKTIGLPPGSSGRALIWGKHPQMYSKASTLGINTIKIDHKQPRAIASPNTHQG